MANNNDTERTKLASHIGLGSAGLKPADKAAGYAGTLCFLCEGEPNCPGGQRFIDVHATRHQLKALAEDIAHFLRTSEGDPDGPTQ